MYDYQPVLPAHSSALERALERASVLYLLDEIPHVWNVETCPPNLLTWLGHALSVDVWDPTWSPDQKRDVIRSTVEVHRKKGTVKAVKEALRSAGYGDATLVERFGWDTNDPNKDHWAEYRVTLTRPISIKQADQVRDILRAIAPARSHLKAFDFTEATNLYNDTIRYDGTFTHGVT